MPSTEGPSIPILMYHHISESQPAGFRKYSVTTRAFRAQMEWLAGAGYRTISFDDLVSARHDGTQLPRRPLIITFDAGFRDAAELAVPAMLASGFTATFYLVAALAGRESEW